MRHGRKDELCDHQPDMCHVFIQRQEQDAGSFLSRGSASWVMQPRGSQAGSGSADVLPADVRVAATRARGPRVRDGQYVRGASSSQAQVDGLAPKYNRNQP
jgi:hypothetical protein